MKSITSISQTKIEEKWYLVDAEGQRIGVLASKIAEILQGKLNNMVRSYHDPKVKVVVINAGKVDVTPKRAMTKFYKTYSGYPGGLKHESLELLLKKNPTKPLHEAVKGMLPRSKRGDLMLANLRLFADSKHSHEAQQPEQINVKKVTI
jgi:large subunit ribosomal protein L13